jgi:hypothetical protein
MVLLSAYGAELHGIGGVAMTYKELVEDIAACLDDEVFCTRLIPRAIQVMKLAQTEDELVKWHEYPGSTGDPRWDALIAGVAAHTWSLSGHEVPLAWTNEAQALEEWFEPGDMPNRWHYYNMLHTPPSIRANKVIFPRSWLEAV